MLEQEVLAGRKRQQLEAEAALKVGSNDLVDLKYSTLVILNKTMHHFLCGY